MFGISGEERSLAQRFIIANAAKKVLDRDMGKIDHVDLKLSPVYNEMMRRLGDKVSIDLRGIRQEMARIGLRVSEISPGVHMIHRESHELKSDLDGIVMKNYVIEYLMGLLNNNGSNPI